MNAKEANAYYLKKAMDDDYAGAPVLDPYESNDYYYHDGLKLLPKENIDFSIPRNLYKRLSIDAGHWNFYTNSLIEPLANVKESDSVFPSAFKIVPKEERERKFKEAKQLYEKNYRLYSSNWTDYEKKKVTAAYSMLQLVEINYELTPHEVELSTIDFRMMRDLIKNCMDDESYRNTSSIFHQTYILYKLLKCFNMMKFWIILYEEVSKDACKSERVQEYHNHTKNTQKHNQGGPHLDMSYEQYSLFHDLSNSEDKLFLLKMIFMTSINYLETGEEFNSNLDTFDEENSKILMEIFKDKELYDPEFAAIPTKIRNYEDAEKAAKLMSKISQKRVELAQKNPENAEAISKVMHVKGFSSCRYTHIPILLKMKEFYSGFVYYATAYFHPDKNVKYKMMKKSIKSWEKMLTPGPGNLPEMMSDFVETKLLLGNAYAVAWNIKYELYQEKPSEDDWNLIKSLVAERVRLGNDVISYFANEHHRISTMYDLVKCYTLVLKDNAAAEAKTGELIDFLIAKPKFLDFFQKLSGMRVNNLVKKPLLISAIINSCK